MLGNRTTERDKGNYGGSNFIGSMRVAAAGLLIMLLAIAAGCSGTGANLSEEDYVEDKINVVTSFYPLYEFAAAIGGEHANVLNLMPAGVDPHHWSPKSRELRIMANAELFVYNGAGFEEWVDKFFKILKADSPLLVVEATEGIDFIEGRPDDGHNHGHKHGPDVDPHTWLSPVVAINMAANIRDGFIQADPAHAADYEANYEALRQRLQDLHEQFATALAGTSKKEIVVTHQAFGYLSREYGLTQMPIMGMSHEAEPRSRDLKRIQDFIREHEVKYVFFEELVSDKVARTLASDLGIETLVLNPLEGLTASQHAAGETYFSLMLRNLDNLLTALE